MPYEELLGWLAYFERRPVGWREDDRTFKLLQAQGVKEKPNVLFKSLEPIYNPVKSVNPDQIDESFKQSFLYQKLLTATAGERIN